MKDKLMILEMLIEAYKHDGDCVEKLKPIKSRLNALWIECAEIQKSIGVLEKEISLICDSEFDKKIKSI